MSDTELSYNIKKILEDKMGGSSMDINVQEKNGTVKLSGMVDVLAEKMSAEKIVNTIEGVKKVENSITIATDGYIPDSDIETYVQSKLQNYRDLTDISPKAQGGAVTLIGHVDNHNSEMKAIELAQQARGVKTVTSAINIDTEGKFDDNEITSKLTQTFENNYLHTADINPTVKDGVVILEGYVDTSFDQEFAQELASKVEGVVKVKNYLQTRSLKR